MAILLPLLVLNSCRDEADKNWTTPAASFNLYNTTLSSNVLYPTMAENSFRLAWDAASAGATYTVQLSSTEDFAKPVTLGTSTTNTYTTTISALNSALLSAGYAPYTAAPVYIRVSTGSSVSSVISLQVTPYPSSAPVITAPTAGSKLVLDKLNPDVKATSITWTDYATSGVPVTYLVEVAPKGKSNFVSLGSVSDLKNIDVTNKTFNDAVLKAGLVADAAADVDVRVTATTQSTGGTIVKTSNVVTISVTPYTAFKNLFLIGDATAAGWGNNNGNQAIFRDPATPTKFHYSGYFGSSQFKLIEVLGQWQPQWGAAGTGVLGSNDGTGADPATIVVPAPGYYDFTMDMVNKTYTFTANTTAVTAPMYFTMEFIGDATPGGWNAGTAMTQSSFDPHQWTLQNVTLTTGSAKFRVDSSWSQSWGSNTEFSGIGSTNNGPNIPVTAGTYNVYFNDLDGSYLLVKL